MDLSSICKKVTGEWWIWNNPRHNFFTVCYVRKVFLTYSKNKWRIKTIWGFKLVFYVCFFVNFYPETNSNSSALRRKKLTFFFNWSLESKTFQRYVHLRQNNINTFWQYFVNRWEREHQKTIGNYETDWRTLV